MQSGRETLQTLDAAIRSLRNEIERVDSELTMASQALAQNRQRQTQTTRQLAGIRLTEIERGEIERFIDSAERQVQETLAQRQGAITALDQKISGAKSRLQELEVARESQNDRVAHAAERVIEMEAKIQGELELDDAYQAQLKIARRADAIADRADEKTEQAEDDRAEKGLPFEEDRLFSYLWKRGYGTTEYRANLLTRFLDGWVARLCDYNKWRVNYWTLLEIPKRLEQHADRVRKTADNERGALKQLEQSAAEAAGLPGLQTDLEQSQAQQDRIDSNIENAEDELNQLLEQRALYAGGKDPYIEKALGVLSGALQRQEIFVLQGMASQSRTRDDDRLVHELDDLRDDTDDIQDEMEQHRKQHANQIARLKELEQVRRRFKRSRYDDVRSGFGNAHLISAVLEQFVRGMVGGNDVWRTIERHQRHRDVGAWPDFGSGGLGGTRRRRNSPWHRPGISINLPTSSRRRRTGGFKLPSSGGFGSRSRSRSRSSVGRRKSGFKTKGGF